MKPMCSAQCYLVVSNSLVSKTISSAKDEIIVVHISGVPGSGKTTLGTRITKEITAPSAIRVVDTDDLLVRDTPIGNELRRLEDEISLSDPAGKNYDTGWRTIFLAEIHKKIEEARADKIRVIVFVGILDHMGHGKYPLALGTAATHLFYIEIEVSQLLFQFYTRYSRLFGEKDQFWTDVSDGREVIPSSEQLLVDAKHTKQWHLERGYKLETSDSIYNHVSRMIK
jgi:hypothetical protein